MIIGLIEAHCFYKGSKMTELERLVLEQIKDDDSRYVSKDARELSVDPHILDSIEVAYGLDYDNYHGYCKDDV